MRRDGRETMLNTTLPKMRREGRETMLNTTLPK